MGAPIRPGDPVVHWTMPIPPLLCEHPHRSVRRTAYRAECPQCGSYWDLDSLNAHVAYDASYPAQRGHFDPRVGALKVRTLRHWLEDRRRRPRGEARLRGRLRRRHLSAVPRRARGAVIGIETNQSAIDRVRATGVRAELLLVEPLPAPRAAGRPLALPGQLRAHPRSGGVRRLDEAATARRMQRSSWSLPRARFDSRAD